MDEWVRYDEEEEPYFDGQQETVLDNIVDALDASVQQSVNRALESTVPGTVQQALAAALKPITKQLKNFAKCHGFGPADHKLDTPTDKGRAKTGQWPHADVLASLPQDRAEDHVYSTDSTGGKVKSKQNVYVDTDTTDTNTTDEEAPPKKKARKAASIVPDTPPVNTPFTFNPSDIVHPRFSDWAPVHEVRLFAREPSERF